MRVTSIIFPFLAVLSSFFASGFSITQPTSPSLHRSRDPVMPSTSSSSAIHLSGGAATIDESSVSMTPGRLLGSLWGTGGFCYILIRSIRKIFPIAAEPFAAASAPLSNFQLAAYIFTCLWFAYVEGYKGFQLKFSPLVVSRSLTLQPGKSSFLHILFAPLYSMGLFHATKKRMIVSWSVTFGVAAIVAGVKRLPYPWRNIVDAGVVVGLTYGMMSILIGYAVAFHTGKCPADPALPDGSNNKKE